MSHGDEHLPESASGVQGAGGGQLARAAERMAAFAHALCWDDVPADVQTLARLHLVDAVGVGIAAAQVPRQREFLTRLLEQVQAPGQAEILGMNLSMSADVAALANGTLMHSLEYDDTHMRSIVHGSAVIVSPVLAVAQERQLPLTEVLRLTVAGWELLVRLGQAAEGAFQRRGFQVTSVGGAVAAAILASVAKGATPSIAARAAGIAGSQAGGIFEFLSDGSNVKALHPGWAAHAGIWASSLAAAGMTGPLSVLEGRHGLYATYADDRGAGDRLQGELDTLGSVWMLREAAFKFYPCCHYIHPYLEAAERLRTQALAAGQRIVSAHCAVAPGAGLVIAEPWSAKQRPRDANDAKYSLPYCVAMALLGHPVDVDAMTGGALNDDALRLASEITATPWEDSGFPARFGADLSVTLADGRCLHERIDQVLGSAERPPTTSQVQAKFLRNVSKAMTEADALRLWGDFLERDTLPALRG